MLVYVSKSQKFTSFDVHLLFVQAGEKMANQLQIPNLENQNCGGTVRVITINFDFLEVKKLTTLVWFCTKQLGICPKPRRKGLFWPSDPPQLDLINSWFVIGIPENIDPCFTQIFTTRVSREVVFSYQDECLSLEKRTTNMRCTLI